MAYLVILFIPETDTTKTLSKLTSFAEAQSEKEKLQRILGKSALLKLKKDDEKLHPTL